MLSNSREERIPTGLLKLIITVPNAMQVRILDTPSKSAAPQLRMAMGIPTTNVWSGDRRKLLQRHRDQL